MDGFGWVAAGTGIALALLAFGLAAWELPDLWNPCHSWGQGNNGTMILSPDDECRSRTGTSETKTGFLLRLAAVDGVVIVAGAASAAGAWRGRAALVLLAGILLAAESVLLFFGLSVGFVVTAGVAVVQFVCAAGLHRRSRRAAARPSPPEP